MRYDPTHPSYVNFLDAFLDSSLSADPTITPFARTPGLFIPVQGCHVFDALRHPQLSHEGLSLRAMPEAMALPFQRRLTFAQHRFTPNHVRLAIHKSQHVYAVTYHHTITPVFYTTTITFGTL